MHLSCQWMYQGNGYAREGAVRVVWAWLDGCGCCIVSGRARAWRGDCVCLLLCVVVGYGRKEAPTVKRGLERLSALFVCKDYLQDVRGRTQGRTKRKGRTLQWLLMQEP